MPGSAENRSLSKIFAILLAIGLSLGVNADSNANERARAGKAVVTGARSMPADPAEHSAEELLVLAVRQQDRPAVDRLLSEGADPNAFLYGEPEELEQEDRLPPLFEAVLVDNEAILVTLIDAGAEIDIARPTDALSFHAPLSFAALHGSRVATSLLIDRGARAGAPACMEDQCGNAMTMAAIGGNAAVVRALAEGATRDDIDELLGVGRLISQFESGSMDGSPGFDSRLLDDHAPADVLPPVIAAARFGHAGIVAQLLRMGADVDQANLKGLTALIAAVETNDLRTVRLLLAAGADPNAGSLRYERLVGNEPVQLERGSGQMPIHVAVAAGNSELVGILLDAGADPNATYDTSYADGSSQPGERGLRTVLNQAIAAGDPGIVRELLRRGADPDRVAGDGRNPLVVAVESGSEEVVRALLESGADVTKGRVQILYGNSAQPLHVAVHEGRHDLVRIFIEAGADVNATYVFDSGDTATALEDAIIHRRTEIALDLIERGADWRRYSCGMGCFSYLELAAQRGEIALIHRFLELGLPLNPSPEYLSQSDGFIGMSALMVAAWEGEAETVTVLLELGAIPTTKNGYGCTALDFAIIAGQEQTAEIVRNAGATADRAACGVYQRYGQ